MGDRANIRFVYDYPRATDEPLALDERRDIFFYTHWGGYEINKTLADALDRGRGRWDDEAYLARIIFSEMVQGDILGETGFGISPYEPDNEYPIPTVDARDMTVNGMPFEEFITSVRSADS